MNIYKKLFNIYNNSDSSIKTAFWYSLPVLKIYSICDINYRFLVLTVNIGTQPKMKPYDLATND